MLAPPLLTETAVRDAFLGAAVRERCVYGVVGEEGLARFPSHRFRGRDTSLLWATHEEAWASAAAVAVNPRVKRYGLPEVLGDLLPGLARHRRLVGLGWNGANVQVELDAQELAERLRLAACDQFVEMAREHAAVFTIEGSAGPALLVSQTRSDILVFPCWSHPDEAHAWLEGPWRDMMVIENALSSFVDERLTWLQRSGHLIGPGYLGGPSTLEMQPEDLAQRLAADRRPY